MKTTELERVLDSLTNQSPIDPGIVEHIENVRNYAKDLAAQIARSCPQSRERSLAFTKLEETVMWAVKGIILHQEEIPNPPMQASP